MFSFSDIVDGLTWLIARFDNKELAFGISLGILTAAIGIGVFFHFWRHRPFVKPIERLASELGNIPADPTADEKISQAGQILSTAPTRLQALWREYRKHLVSDPKTGGYLNLVDPRLWFSLESLPGRGYEQWCSTWAGVFLTIGLLFTFIGLSAALLKVGGIDGADSAAMKAAITGILGVSSAKFITSIAGLLAYIGFSLVNRRYQSSQRQAAIDLADAVQHLSIPLSPELLLFEQNETASKQLDRLDRFTDDLAIAIDGKLESRLKDLTAAFEKQLDNIGQTLPQATATPIVDVLGKIQQALPEATANPIVAALHGLGDKIGQGNAEGMRNMLGEFLTGLHGGAGDKMQEAALKLAEMVAQLGEVKDSLGGAGKTFGKDIADAAEALRKASDQLTQGGAEAGTKLKQATDAAGTHLQEKIEEVSNKLDRIGGTLAGIPVNIEMSLNETLKKLTSAIDTLVGRLTRSGEDGGNALRKGGEDAGTGLKTAVEQAGRDFDTIMNQATQNLVAQLADSLGELESSIQDFADWLSVTESSLKTLPGAVASQVQNLNAAGQTFTTAGQTVTDAGETLRQAAAPLQQTTTAIQAGLAQIHQGVVDTETNRRQTQQEVQTVLTGLKAMAEAAQRTFETHEKRFGQADEAMAKALTSLRDGVKGVTDELNKAFGEYDQHITNAMNALESGIENLSDAIETLSSAKAPSPMRRF